MKEMKGGFVNALWEILKVHQLSQPHNTVNQVYIHANDNQAYAVTIAI